MAKTGDVMFTYDTTEINYMLAVDANGRKAWQVQHLFTQPPSLIKNKIDMTIKAAPKMRRVDGTVITTRTIDAIMAELQTLTNRKINITLNGLDAQFFNVLLDPKATRVLSVADETGRKVEYDIDISCWGLCT